MPLTPEQQARQDIDKALEASGWCIQTVDAVNLAAGRGVAVCEFPLKKGHGLADYLLFVDREAAGVIEAKKAGVPLSGVEVQAEKYATGLPGDLPAHRRPLPFIYLSTGVETRFTNLLDPDPRSRRVFTFHRPETLADWLEEEPIWLPLIKGKPQPESEGPATLRARLRHLPALDTKGLWPAQVKAIQNLELSLAKDRPRALIQMATGSGKTFTAVSSIYRLVREAKARRVLFLVDRANLGRQAFKEFQSFDTPEGRKFHQEFIVQNMTNSRLDPQARVVICTIQRLYSLLKGEEIDPELEEVSAYTLDDLRKDTVPVAYNPTIPIETFDFIWTDEAHRSIYNLWRQVLEYFDAFLIGLTATPSKQTFGFFDQNLVMEYGHEAAVADGCNVDFTVYRIRTRITDAGATVEAETFVDKRERDTRKVRWEKLDEPLTYESSDLNRDVVASDQIRTVIRTYRDRLFTDIFPGRTEVPKTLIFAMDDSHADDIVNHVREVFGRGNDFCEKITYRTGTVREVDEKTGAVRYVSGGTKSPETLLSAFRNSFNPRIVVTVDMIATGTDVKPLEVVMFMRSVKSRNFFEQMKGRGVRVIEPADLRAVTPDARIKDRFVIVDAVGVCETELMDTKPLDKDPGVPFEKLVQTVAFGNTSPEIVSSLASRLARLNRQLGKSEHHRITELTGGLSLPELVQQLVVALDPDRHVEEARAIEKLPSGTDPSAAQVASAAAALIKEAVAPLATNPGLRNALIDLKRTTEQTIDHVTQDEVLDAGFSAEAKEKAKGIVADFEKFIEQNKDEITALQVLYSQPYAKRLRFKDIKALAEAIKAPPRSWTPEKLWRAYEQLDRSKVRGAGATRLITDVVALVRFALHKEQQLIPFAEHVEARFQNWLAQQQNNGQKFSEEQLEWLSAIKEHVATSFGIEKDDFEDVPFNQKGGLGKVYALFGKRLEPMLAELNEVLVA